MKAALFTTMFEILLGATNISTRARESFTSGPKKTEVEIAIDDLLNYAMHQGIIGRRSVGELQQAWIDMHKKKRGAHVL